MMQNRTKRRIGVPEILAPAGSMESLKAAVAAGCDAVYMGGSKFGARAYAQNPEDPGSTGGSLVKRPCPARSQRQAPPRNTVAKT